MFLESRRGLLTRRIERQIGIGGQSCAAHIAAVSAEHRHAVDTLGLCFLEALRPALDDKIRIQALHKLQERKIKGQLWRLLR